MIIGIDYSITCPAICLYDSEKQWQVRYLTDKARFVGSFCGGRVAGSAHAPWVDKIGRFIGIASWTMMQVAMQPLGRKEFFLEGYSMASTGSRLFDIGENTAMLKYLIYQNSFPFTIVPPATWKKEMIGKGNAKKTDVGPAFANETKIDLSRELGYDGKHPFDSSPMSDIADAYWIARYGEKISQQL